MYSNRTSGHPEVVDELISQMDLLFDRHDCQKTMIYINGVGRSTLGETEKSLCSIVDRMKWYDDSRVVPILCEQLRNMCDCFKNSRSLSWGIIDALGEIEDARAVPALCERLAQYNKRDLDFKNPDADTYTSHEIYCIARALERIGDTRAIRALRAVDPGRVKGPVHHHDDDRFDYEFNLQRDAFNTHKVIRRMKRKRRRKWWPHREEDSRRRYWKEPED